MKQQFAAALPQHLTPDRFCRIALTALTRTPKLADCTQESLMRCLLDLSAYGIEPDGRRAHLIPYGNQCTLILDWKGLAELAMRSGIIAKLHADIVCENDVFEYNLGEVVQHKIDFKAPRGEMYAAYAMAVTKDGPVFVAVLNKDEIDGIRKRSKSGNSGPWQTDYNEMAKKTAFRRLAKWLPLSAEFRDAVDKDDDVVIERDVTPKTAARATPLDPFASLPEAPAEAAPVVEADVVEPAHEVAEPTEEDMIIADLLGLVNESDAEALASYVEQANKDLFGAKQEMVKKAIAARAKALGVKWSKEKGGFEA
jgi:recombination protein RecT